MDYTSSNSYATDGGTAQRMHLQAQATPTAVSDTDLNGLIWEALAVIKAGGLAPVAFDKAVPATYTQLRDAIAIAVRLQSAAYAVAGGTADALTGTYAPVVPALVNGLTLYVRAASANATAAPTFSPNGIAAKTVVKGNGLALVAGDIAGAGHWIELQYDLTLDKWVLLNPAMGTVTVTTTTDATFVDSSAKPASTGWIRGAMSAIAVAAGFAASLAANGYVKFPTWLGGLIIQWGITTSVTITNTQAATSATLPIAFPNNFFKTIGSAEASQASISASLVKSGLTQVNGVINNTSGTSYTGGIAYVAIGN